MQQTAYQNNSQNQNQSYQCPLCSFEHGNFKQMQRHQFEKNHIYFCGFESSFVNNQNFTVECDKWFYTRKEAEEHRKVSGHFYDKNHGSGQDRNRNQHQQQQPQQVEQPPRQRRNQDLIVNEPPRQMPQSAQQTRPRGGGNIQRGGRQEQMQHQYPQPQMQHAQHPANQVHPRAQNPHRQQVESHFSKQPYQEHAVVHQYQAQPHPNQTGQGRRRPEGLQQTQQPPRRRSADSKNVNGANYAQPLFECVSCQRDFHSKAGLFSHIEKKHPEQNEIESVGLKQVMVPIEHMLPKQGNRREQQQVQHTQQQQNQYQQQKPAKRQQQQLVQPEYPQVGQNSKKQQPVAQRPPKQQVQENVEVHPMCTTCAKEFPSGPQALARHLEMTGHVQAPSCEVCNKEFRTDTGLQSHQNDTGHMAQYGTQAQQSQTMPKKQQQHAARTDNRQQPQAKEEQRQRKDPKGFSDSSKNQQKPQAQPKEEKKQGGKKQTQETQQPDEKPLKKKVSADAGPVNIHKCQICMTVYQTQSQLRDHRKTDEHSKAVMQTAQKYNNDGKSQQVARDNKNDFQCTQCIRSFQKDQSLQTHIEMMHGAKTAPAKANQVKN